jgi:hypothetical protein
MIRRQLAFIAAPLVVVASDLDVVIFNQGLSLAATALVGFAVVTALTTIGVLAAVFVFRHGAGANTRVPAIHV